MLYFLNNSYFSNKFFDFSNKRIFFEIFLPVEYCYNKLRNLGFIHKNKNCTFLRIFRAFLSF
mgnify:CR=1 FL=1